MTDVTVSAEAVEEAQPAGMKPDALADQLIGRLVDRAKADGIKLTGEGELRSAAGGSGARSPSRTTAAWARIGMCRRLTTSQVGASHFPPGACPTACAVRKLVAAGQATYLYSLITPPSTRVRMSRSGVKLATGRGCCWARGGSCPRA